MNTNPSSTSFSHDLPPLLLTDRRNHIRLNFTASLSLQIPDSSWLTDEKWKNLEIIRGAGLCLETKLRWNNHQAPEGLVEAFGQWVSSAEMWSQLQLSTSLRVPARTRDGVDVIIGLIRSSPTLAATEMLISTLQPEASLTRITAEFSFSRNGLEVPGLVELAPLVDTAFRGLWSTMSDVAPLLGKVGCLEGVSEKREYVGVVADAITRVVGRSRGVGLTGADALGVERNVWGVLLGVLRAKKGGAGSRLKSMVVMDVQAVESTEEDLLFEGGRHGDGDTWLETETEDELFTWEEDDEEGSLFLWDNDECYEDDLCLFEELEGPDMAIGYCGNGKDELLFMEDSESMLEEGLLMRSEDEDMMWIF